MMVGWSNTTINYGTGERLLGKHIQHVQYIFTKKNLNLCSKYMTLYKTMLTIIKYFSISGTGFLVVT